jgi:hypothetical protein
MELKKSPICFGEKTELELLNRKDKIKECRSCTFFVLGMYKTDSWCNYHETYLTTYDEVCNGYIEA